MTTTTTMEIAPCVSTRRRLRKRHAVEGNTNVERSSNRRNGELQTRVPRGLRGATSASRNTDDISQRDARLCSLWLWKPREPSSVFSTSARNDDVDVDHGASGEHNVFSVWASLCECVVSADWLDFSITQLQNFNCKSAIRGSHRSANHERGAGSLVRIRASLNWILNNLIQLLIY